MTTVVLVPAHNEEASLPETLTTLQSEGFDNIVVVSDNSTDGTVDVARNFNVDVFETVNNTAKKAGALNQAIKVVEPELSDDDFILVVDADTQMVEGFKDNVHKTFENFPDLGAVGGVFRGEKPTNLLALCQHNEYARFGREIDRTRRTMVLSGTSSYMRVSVLREVSKARGTVLPGTHGDVYDEESITEDNELSLAIKTLGYRLASPVECAVVTELMATPGQLHRQRLRWYRGAIDNLKIYGWTPVTRRYWFQQFMLTWGSLMFALMLIFSTTSLTMFGWTTSWLWLFVSGIFMLERTVSVWRFGTKQGRLLAVTLIPEMIYCILLYVAFIHGAVQSWRKTDAQWAHVKN